MSGTKKRLEMCGNIFRPVAVKPHPKALGLPLGMRGALYDTGSIYELDFAVGTCCLRDRGIRRGCCEREKRLETPDHMGNGLLRTDRGDDVTFPEVDHLCF